ncbi:MAG: Gfo/Idh/MocA family oxidoreductase [Anaerolineae bacterium]|nr:Gfo/Idh/MocA family oxidoreductase [Anaerolineae bacterium]
MNGAEVRKRGIGFVGLGGITVTHRKGYRIYGLPFVAGYDPSPRARAAFAAEVPEARVYDTLEGLLNDPDVEVVDLATPHTREARLTPLQAIVKAGKPVYIQKPMAAYYQDALEMVECVEEAGVAAMVNQNMVWSPGAQALARLIVDEQAIGEPLLAQGEVRLRSDYSAERWFGKDERNWTAGNAVHLISVMHMVFGPPESIFAVTGVDSDHPGVTYDAFGTLIWRYRNGFSISLLTNGMYYGINPKPYVSEEIWVQGARGIIDTGPEEFLTVSWREDPTQPGGPILRRTYDIPGAWMPDGMGRGMQHFQQALDANAEPLCSVQDNLYVMAVIEATYKSNERREPVTIAEIMGDRFDPNYGPGWVHRYQHG